MQHAYSQPTLYMLSSTAAQQTLCFYRLVFIVKGMTRRKQKIEFLANGESMSPHGVLRLLCCSLPVLCAGQLASTANETAGASRALRRGQAKQHSAAAAAESSAAGAAAPDKQHPCLAGGSRACGHAL
jgi:hypothetical protein